jgi:serine/threonine-protein kinase RsbW
MQGMTSTLGDRTVIRLEFLSGFAMLDLVQVASDAIGQTAGLDEDAIHWVGVALRESVINAITHGNRQDTRKRVFVELAIGRLADGSSELVIRVRDEGPGFDPDEIEDPLAPENLLKASGRGIFIIRNFMDVVDLYRAPEGGMEIRMVKRVHAGS